jgi:hypothetical protein
MRRIHIPPSHGFGQEGSPEHGIPGDSTLVIGEFPASQHRPVTGPSMKTHDLWRVFCRLLPIH